MNNLLRNINQIIERDSKDTTYKFALLRGSIEIIQEKSPYIKKSDDIVYLPLGLLVVKWLEFYYPIIDADLPQKNGDKIISNTLSFRSEFKAVTEFYKNKGGMSVFITELINGKIDPQIEVVLYGLCKTVRNTIIRQPMKYIGTSIYKEYYKIFKPLRGTRISRPEKLSLEFLIQNFGEFTIPESYAEVFELFGSYILGSNSLLINWAHFTVQSSKETMTLEYVLSKISTSHVEARNVTLAQNFFKDLKNERKLECVWSGKKINSDLNIDHVLPFCIWKNNELWNLLPAKSSVNNKKRDKIPSVELLNSRRNVIIDYWNLIKDAQSDVFEREIKLNLINSEQFTSGWQESSFNSLVEKCSYLINTRGFEPWTYS